MNINPNPTAIAAHKMLDHAPRTLLGPDFRELYKDVERIRLGTMLAYVEVLTSADLAPGEVRVQAFPAGFVTALFQAQQTSGRLNLRAELPFKNWIGDINVANEQGVDSLTVRASRFARRPQQPSLHDRASIRKGYLCVNGSGLDLSRMGRLTLYVSPKQQGLELEVRSLVGLVTVTAPQVELIVHSSLFTYVEGREVYSCDATVGGYSGVHIKRVYGAVPPRFSTHEHGHATVGGE